MQSSKRIYPSITIRLQYYLCLQYSNCVIGKWKNAKPFFSFYVSPTNKTCKKKQQAHPRRTSQLRSIDQYVSNILRSTYGKCNATADRILKLEVYSADLDGLLISYIQIALPFLTRKRKLSRLRKDKTVRRRSLEQRRSHVTYASPRDLRGIIVPSRRSRRACSLPRISYTRAAKTVKRHSVESRD